MSYEQEVCKAPESYLQMTCQATHCVHNTLRRTHKPNCDVGYIELDDHGICIHFSKEEMPLVNNNPDDFIPDPNHPIYRKPMTARASRGRGGGLARLI